MKRRFGARLVCAALLVAPLACADGDTSPDEVKVHVAGDTGLVLERQIDGTPLWESLCVGACDAPVPRHGMYRVGGPGVRPSLPIALLPSRDRRVRLEVSPAYRAAWTGGIAMLVLGPLVIAGGMTAVVAGSAQAQFDCPPNAFCAVPSATVPSDALVVGGVLTIAIGALLAGAGAVALLLADHSRVRQVVSFAPNGLTVTF